MKVKDDKSHGKVLSTLLFVSVLVLMIVYEMRTSTLEAYLFSWCSKNATWEVQEGESKAIVYPVDGPFDISRGYTQLPNFQKRLKEKDYIVTSQARQSKIALLLGRNDIPIPYERRDDRGLQLNDKDGLEAYHVNRNTLLFPSFKSIPPLLVKILLHRENRELLDFDHPFLNPSVEWDRLSLASIKYLGKKLFGIPGGIGGSTLVTQMVKFRHSSKGITRGPVDKIRQIIGGSLWAYRKGPTTVETRKEIVREYLNEMPLGAAKGYGEINGIGKGMWAWFGKDIDQIMSDLQMDETNLNMLYRKAETLKGALSLIIATRNPSFYLQKEQPLLEKKANGYLSLLEAEGIISPVLKKAALEIPLEFRPGAPVPPPLTLVERKGTDSVRISLLELLGIERLYELDRLDMTVDTTFDLDVQQKVNKILNSLYIPEFLAENGFLSHYLLNKGDPKGVIYSFALFESLPSGNLLRVQADTLNKPLNINTGIKLELGSTAKIRTLASYLMVIDSLYGDFAEKDKSDLLKKKTQVNDPLSKWVLDYLLYHPKATQEEVLKASLQRSISGNPHQGFFTGGGMQIFNNFNKDQDNRFFTIEEGLCQSVNLVFIRLMKEVVDYYIASLGYNVKTLLLEINDPERLTILREAMELESIEFLRKYYWIYAPKTYKESFAILCQSSRHPLKNWTILYLKENQDATLEQYITAAELYFEGKAINLNSLKKLFKAYRGKSFTLIDEAYLLGKHPIEVWLVYYLKDHLGASWKKVLEDSKNARMLSSSWIYKTRFQHAQNLRIKRQLERKAFAEIHRTWKFMGYPFGTLVPSLATAIGSSADRPVNLAEFMGIILNDGIYKPMISFKGLHFGVGTPYETHLSKPPETKKRVMSPLVARSLKDALRQVVKRGTAQRIKNTFTLADGISADVGGKTGTGDNRFETFRRNTANGNLKIINRTSTFVFYADRYFGIVTAHVEGSSASQYEFTSALAVQVLKTLWPALQPLFTNEGQRLDNVGMEFALN
ncbi:MAG: transglycosylase domain-containing protein [Pseudomonadota bacterium]